ncbi:MAG: site-specific integrase [Chloroflexi bacterium]|nr:site-specific integrase [Chloroflexota bacterium]MBP6804897.1 site-specific integrase [Chloroflexota bacterium]MBP7591272.1 site-specific integrase [Chloroflexota bacterium]
MEKQPQNQIVPIDNGRAAASHALQTQTPSPLQIAGQIANRVAAQNIFQRYLSEKSANTIKRHARDLELFAEYLLDAGLELRHGADFQTNPAAWKGVSWGIVEGFVQWQLGEGYAISSVNARLSTVKVYAQMAVKTDVIPREEGMLIHSVKGYSRASGQNVDEQRDQTRIDEVTYAYKPESRRRNVVVTRRSTKKQTATLLDEETAVTLTKPRNPSPQAYRDALLMCLLLNHGLRASEVALLKAGDIDLNTGEMRFYRPKVKGTPHEWTTHKLTPDTMKLAAHYIGVFYPSALLPDGPLIVATTRLLKNGEGGHLLAEGLNRVRLSERVAWLGKQVGLPKKLSAHDCRHTCATKMARLDYSVDELMAWFGWTSAQTAMRYVTAVDVKERYKG